VTPQTPGRVRVWSQRRGDSDRLISSELWHDCHSHGDGDGDGPAGLTSISGRVTMASPSSRRSQGSSTTSTIMMIITDRDSESASLSGLAAARLSGTVTVPWLGIML
jgi:hypothetical protein